jgi:cellulose synthase/poly-beta-1,6-N-acetylglucosamine synthase-like glycosyltransferase
MVGIYAVNWCVLAVISIRKKVKSPCPPRIDEWPTVSIHLPVYNESAVVSRLLDSCIRLDYPREKLEILVIDDSTDKTTDIVNDYCSRFPSIIKVIRRHSRQGFKAGALQEALRRSQGEFIAIFDADYVPPPDFLRRIIPYLYISEDIAFVQARVGHLNSHSTWVTKAVSLAIDGYFLVEQRARFAANLLPHFLGTSGVFRRKAIESAGGWSSDTLVEDLDLSIRLQLAGWKHIYVPEVVCSGEVPPTLSVFVRQQMRWAKGFSECLRKYWRTILYHKSLTLFQKIESLFQLACYFIFVLGVVGFFLAIPYYLIFPWSFLLYDYWKCSVATVAIIASVPIYAAPVLIYGLAIAELRKMEKISIRRAFHLGYLAIVGYVVSWAGALAVIDGLTGRRSVFRRTPKFGLVDRHSQRRLQNLLPA